MKIAKKILSISIMVVMIATTFGIVTAPVNAASGLPKVSSLKASASQTTVTLSWTKLSKKQLKKVKGIAIYRNGTLIKSIGKKSKSFTNSGLKAGTSYSYTVKTYKTTKKKEWFNKQTGKWQKKKPAKKYRGKSRKIKKYSAGVTVNVATTTSGSDQYTSGNKKQQTITSNGSKTLNIGQKYNLNASASSGLSVTYTSNNTSIATVNSSGQVTAISSGKTSIFIRQGGNSTYAPVEKAVTITVNPADVTIKFDPNGGSGTMSNQTLIAGSGKLSLNTFTRETYTFKGWNTNASATTAKWADGATFSQIEDTPTNVTLYAIWEKNPGPITISGPFTVDIPSNMINNGENVININMGQVQIPMTIPDHVARIDWTVTLTGTADAYNTITHTTNNNGKTLYLKANNTLNSRDNFGKLKYTGTLTMEDGYIYSGTPTVTFTITNTIYPTVGPITNKTYDFTSFNRPISNGDVRTLYVFKELPANSTININLEEFYGGYDNVKLMLPTSGWEILNKSSVVGKIISPIAHNGQIRLIKAGTFQITSTENNKTMTFVLSGSGSTFINNYYNHLNSVASQCKTSNEINTIKNCLAYIYTHYTYNDNGGGMWTDGYGNCAAGNQYLTDLLNVCGIESYYRNASIERANHYNTAVILSDGTKYIVDGTPDYDAASTSAAITYINDTMDLHSGKHSKIILWDEYDAWYDAVTISFFGY